MDDRRIIELYWERSEDAISRTAQKYGRFCRSIAYNILHNDEDSEECVSDTYLKAWNEMPPKRPEKLHAFLGRITRNISLHRYEYKYAQKRGGGEVTLALDELGECIPSREKVENTIDDLELAALLNRFLAALAPQNRIIFVRRYWYLYSIKEISAQLGVSECKIKTSLFRTRNALRTLLEKEDTVL